MTVQGKVRIDGDEELIRKLAPGYLLGPPLHDCLATIMDAWKLEARALAPVDTGALRGSITTRLDPAPVPLWGTIGSTLGYARAVHDGAAPHFPPPDALRGWAGRHGFGTDPGDLFVLARAISRRARRPRPFLDQAMAGVRQRLPSILTRAGRDLEQRWGA
jgi:hypothetical protein